MDYSLAQIPCIVLCGGKGTRLQSVVADIPKPMAPLHSGMPFLHFLLLKLNQQGIRHFHLATGYQSQIIESYFETHETPFQVTIWKEHEPMGTGGAIRSIVENLSDSHVLVVNGDSYFDLDLSDFISRASLSQKEAVLALKKMDKGNRYGQVILNECTIVSFEEKRDFEHALINSGIYWIQRNSFLQRTTDGCFSLEKEYFEKLVNTGCFGGIEQHGFFIDIGIPEDYFYAQTHLKL